VKKIKTLLISIISFVILAAIDLISYKETLIRRKAAALESHANRIQDIVDKIRLILNDLNTSQTVLTGDKVQEILVKMVFQLNNLYYGYDSKITFRGLGILDQEKKLVYSLSGEGNFTETDHIIVDGLKISINMGKDEITFTLIAKNRYLYLLGLSLSNFLVGLNNEKDFFDGVVYFNGKLLVGRNPDIEYGHLQNEVEGFIFKSYLSSGDLLAIITQSLSKLERVTLLAILAYSFIARFFIKKEPTEYRKLKAKIRSHVIEQKFLFFLYSNVIFELLGISANGKDGHKLTSLKSVIISSIDKNLECDHDQTIREILYELFEYIESDSLDRNVKVIKYIDGVDENIKPRLDKAIFKQILYNFFHQVFYYICSEGTLRVWVEEQADSLRIVAGFKSFMCSIDDIEKYSADSQNFPNPLKLDWRRFSKFIEENNCSISVSFAKNDTENLVLELKIHIETKNSLTTEKLILNSIKSNVTLFTPKKT